MNRIMGNPTVTPMQIPDWEQTNEKKANFIKNKPTYLTEFFKPIPEGASINDITEEGCYLVANKNKVISAFSMYYVVKGRVTASEKCVRQFWYQHTGGITNNFNIKQRYLKEGSESWSEWEDLGITGGGTVTGTTDYNELINTPIKNILIDENIDDVKEVGCYVTFFNDGDSVEYGDSCLIIVGTYRDGTYSVDYMPDWYSPSQLRIANNYLDSPKIEYRKWQEGNQKWTDWEDIYATKSYVDSVNAKINEIIESAPDALNTLKELADALNNDPDFAATIANQLANKADKEYINSEIEKSESKTSYLTGFFKSIPEGKTLDDLKEVGVYLGYDTANYNGFPYEMPYLLFVSHHENTLGDIDAPMVCQIKVGCSETGAIIPESVVKWRYCGQDNEWWEWTTVPEKGMDITLSNLIDLEYNPESENAQSGKAVSEAIDGSVGDINNALEELIEIQDSIIKGNEYIPSSGNIEVDQEYNPESPNAQSAIEGSVGGETPFELIAELTTSEEVSNISIDKDINGDAFELKEVYMWVEFPEHTTTFSPYLGVRGNGNGDAFLATDKSKTTFICTASSELPKIKLEQYQYGYAWKTCKLNSLSSIGTFNRMTTATYSGQVMPTGTIIRIYGKRV